MSSISDKHSVFECGAYSLPLEGKVSAKPTDEVFIQIRYLLCPDRQEI